MPKCMSMCMNIDYKLYDKWCSCGLSSPSSRWRKLFRHLQWSWDMAYSSQICKPRERGLQKVLLFQLFQHMLQTRGLVASLHEGLQHTPFLHGQDFSVLYYGRFTSGWAILSKENLQVICVGGGHLRWIQNTGRDDSLWSDPWGRLQMVWSIYRALGWQSGRTLEYHTSSCLDIRF